MALFAVHMLMEVSIDGHRSADATNELSVHVVEAGDVDEAIAKGEAIGRSKRNEYLNADGGRVRWDFARIVEVQALFDAELKDGVEVSFWLWEGDRLDLHRRWGSGSTDKSSRPGASYIPPHAG